MAFESRNRKRKRIRREMSELRARFHVALTLLNEAAYGFNQMATQNTKLLKQNEALIEDLAMYAKGYVKNTVKVYEDKDVPRYAGILLETDGWKKALSD